MSFNSGDRVRVIYEGTVTSVYDDEIYIEDQTGFIHSYPKQVSGTFERISPEVKLGDIWRTDDGYVYVVRNTYDDGIQLYRVTMFGVSVTVEQFFICYPNAERLYRYEGKIK